MSESKSSEDLPQAFVNWAKIKELLAQANTHGVTTTLLMQAHGPLLCVAGESKAADVIGALVGNIWKQYKADVEGNLKAKNIGTMIIDCENGKLSVAEISKFLVCLHTPGDIGLGLLKLKTEQLLEHLAPLHNVYKS